MPMAGPDIVYRNAVEKERRCGPRRERSVFPNPNLPIGFDWNKMELLNHFKPLRQIVGMETVSAFESQRLFIGTYRKTSVTLLAVHICDEAPDYAIFTSVYCNQIRTCSHN